MSCASLTLIYGSSGNPGLLVSYLSAMTDSRDATLAPLRTYSIVRLHQTSGSGALAFQSPVEHLPYELVSLSFVCFIFELICSPVSDLGFSPGSCDDPPFGFLRNK